MFLRCIALLLLSILVYSEARLLVIQVDYLINLEEIKEEKCVNKEVPESTCHGMCYVRKQITLDENTTGKEAPSIPKTLETERAPMIANEPLSWDLKANNLRSVNPLFHYQKLISDAIFEIDAPPPQC